MQFAAAPPAREAQPGRGCRPDAEVGQNDALELGPKVRQPVHGECDLLMALADALAGGAGARVQSRKIDCRICNLVGARLVGHGLVRMPVRFIGGQAAATEPMVVLRWTNDRAGPD